MGCRLTRTRSAEICEKQQQTTEASPMNGEKERRTGGSNGQSVLLRRDTPQGLTNSNGAVTTLNLPNKPLGEVESASQADFFKMLEDKIQNGPDYEEDQDASLLEQCQISSKKLPGNRLQ